MAPGLDATMIGPIEKVECEDTDFLCISSFTYNFVMISWLENGELQKEFERLGLSGKVVSLAEDTQAEPGVGKRIFNLQLSPDSRVPQILSTLQKLLENRQVKTVSIGLQTKSSTERPSDNLPRGSKVSRGHAEDDKKVAPSDERTNRNAIRSKTTTEAEEKQLPSDDDDDDYRHLDKLVDDLDALDL